LSHYDYGDTDTYFITLTVYNRACIFGEVVDGVKVLNDMGRIVVSEWNRTPIIRSQVALDEYVVMPNHFHALVAIEKSRRGVSHTPSDKFHSPSQTLGAIVRGFKSATTKVINQMRGTPGIPPWQRNYYEHVVRKDSELQRIREYIVSNPLQWA